MTFIKIEKATFGHMNVYDCNLCDSRKDYQITSLQIEANIINICDDCLIKLKDTIDEYLYNDLIGRV